MTHPALVPDAVAVVTGGGSGIGLAAAKRFLSLGMRVCIAERDDARLAAAVEELHALGDPDRVLGAAVDVAKLAEMRTLEATVAAQFGGTDVLMNNAGIQPGSDIFDESETWERIVGVNLWGIIHGSQVFAPGMIAHGRPGLIINTGSKQGITTPPGDPAYNVAKAGVRAFTEALQHELRSTPWLPDQRPFADSRVRLDGSYGPWANGKSRQLLGRRSRPSTSWWRGSTTFTSLCPDNDVARPLDEKRILWAAGDIVENRPALSRWHPDYADAFKSFVEAKD